MVDNFLSISNKHNPTQLVPLLFSLQVDIASLLDQLDVSKPKSTFNFFLKELAKENQSKSMNLASAAKMFKALNVAEKDRLLKLAEDDKQRYIDNLFLVKKHLIEIPLAEYSSEFLIFKEEHKMKTVDVSEKMAIFEVNKAWVNLTEEEKYKYTERKQETVELIEELLQITSANLNGWHLFVIHQFAEHKENNKAYNLLSATFDWRNLAEKHKMKLNEEASRINKQRKHKINNTFYSFNDKPAVKPFHFLYLELKAACNLEYTKGPLTYCKRLFEDMPEEERIKYQKRSEREVAVLKMKKEDIVHQLKNLIRRPPTGFCLFIKEHGARLVMGKELRELNLSQLMQNKWNELNDYTKTTFNDWAAELRRECIKNDYEVNSKPIVKPEKPRPPIALFVADQVKKLMSNYNKLTIGEANKMAYKQVALMSVEEKQFYQALYEKNKVVYEKQLEEIKNEDLLREKCLKETSFPIDSRNKRRDLSRRKSKSKSRKSEKMTKRESTSIRKNEDKLKSEKSLMTTENSKSVMRSRLVREQTTR